MITGADGAIGKEIALLLSKNKKFDLYLFSYRKTEKNKKKIFFQNFTKPINYNIKPDAIIHCAAKHGFSKTGNSMKNVYSTNLKITKNLIKFSNKKKVKKLIFLSSVDIYGKINTNEVRENNKSIGSNLYGKSKLISERLFCQKKNCFKTICLRIPGIFTFDLSKNHPLIVTIIKKTLRNENINIYNFNAKFNNILDTYEIVRMIKIFLNRKKIKSDYYNFAASKPLKFVNVIKLIKKILNSKSQIINQKKIKKSFTISNRKISKEFNFKVATTVKIITRCCKEIANNRYSNKFNLSTK